MQPPESLRIIDCVSHVESNHGLRGHSGPMEEVCAPVHGRRCFHTQSFSVRRPDSRHSRMGLPEVYHDPDVWSRQDSCSSRITATGHVKIDRVEICLAQMNS